MKSFHIQNGYILCSSQACSCNFSLQYCSNSIATVVSMCCCKVQHQHQNLSYVLLNYSFLNDFQNAVQLSLSLAYIGFFTVGQFLRVSRIRVCCRYAEKKSLDNNQKTQKNIMIEEKMKNSSKHRQRLRRSWQNYGNEKRNRNVYGTTRTNNGWQD